MRCINRKYGGFFMEEVCKKIGYSGATLLRIMKAKDYRLTISFIFLCTDALITMELRMFLNYLRHVHPHIQLPSVFSQLENVNWDKLEDKHKYIEDLLESIKHFNEEFVKFVQVLSQRSENFYLLNTFLWTEVSALIQLLHSIQVGDFDSRITACKRMTPLFFSMDAVNYKRWASLDIAIKASLYPKDLLDLFTQEGVWRSALSTNHGAWKVYDQAHEESYNKPMKSAISQNQQSPEILENIGNWLPIRGKLVSEFQQFIFPKTKWADTEYLRSESQKEMQRYNQKFQKTLEFFEEHFLLSIEDILDSEFCQGLHSINGDELIGKKEDLLEAHIKGKEQYEAFVKERLINRVIQMEEPIKKAAVPIFSYCDTSTKKVNKTKKKTEKEELQKQNKIINILRDRPLLEVNSIQV